MDYNLWIKRLEAFIETLRNMPGPFYIDDQIMRPLTPTELQTVLSSWDRNLPGELAKFWTEGSAQCYVRYGWNAPASKQDQLREIFPYQSGLCGGPQFYSAAEVDSDPMDTSWFDGDIMSGEPEAAEHGKLLWSRSIPFLHMMNGDMLALDCDADGCDPDNPPVVYLSHDSSDSCQISPSFTEFLTRWEEICYIGPESWLLNHWIPEGTNRIDPGAYKTAQLRELLTTP